MINRFKNLSNSEKHILDGLATEYKSMLIESIARDKNLRSISDINIRDIVEKDTEIKKHLEMPRKTKRKYLFIEMMKTFGILYTMLGVIIYFVLNYENLVYSSTLGISILLVLTGILIIGISIVFSAINKVSFFKNTSGIYKELYQINNPYDLIDKWLYIEKYSNILYNKINLKSKHIPISQIFKLLYTEGLLYEREEEKFKQLLSLRNVLVHEGVEKIDSEMLLSANRFADEIIDRLDSKHID